MRAIDAAANPPHVGRGPRYHWSVELYDGSDEAKGRIEAAPTRSLEPNRPAATPADPELSAATLAAGTMLGRFEVIDLLGRGGMGRVFRARDTELDREVAVKLLRSITTASAEARLLREAQGMAQLSHPNLLPVFDVGHSEFGSYIAMQLVQGMTLRRWLGTKERTWEEIVGVLVAAGRGLQAAHDAGLVHRDFKPSNVMVGADGHVFVMDFGLVRAVGDMVASASTSTSGGYALSDRMTETGSILGTPPYMAPEQSFGTEADVRSDQYSFCVTAWRALFDMLPFTAATFAELTKLKQTRRPTQPRSPRRPRWLVDVLRRGLAPKPDDRFPSMTALLEALDRGAARSSRPVWLAGTLAVGVGALAVGSQLAGADQEQPALCRSAADKLEGVWDGPTRAKAESAVLGTELPYAADTWQRVRPVLDEYASQWQQGHSDACAATHLRHEQAEAVMDARMRCLDGRMRRLTALVETLHDADAKVLLRAVGAARGLPDVGACADAEYVAAQVAPPDDPVARQRAEAISEQLARAFALEGAGKYDSARDLAEHAHAEALELGYPPAIIRATVRVASLHVHAGRYPQAVELFEQAYFDAGQQGMDHTRVMAAFYMVETLDERLADYPGARTWAKHAQADVDRLGDPHLEGRLLSLIGAIESHEGDFDAAEQTLRRAMVVLEKAPGFEPLDLTDALDALGHLLVQQRRLDQAHEYIDRQLAIEKEALGEQHPATATTMGNLGGALLSEGRLQEALAALEPALAIQERALGADHPELTPWLGNIAIIHGTRGEHEKALHNFHRVLSIQERTMGANHPAIADSLNNIGVSHRALEQYDQALEFFGRSLAITERSVGPEHASLASSVANLGTIHRKRGDYEQALEQFRRALSILEHAHDPTHPHRASALVEIAETLLLADEPELALEQVELAMAILDRNPRVAAASQARIHFTVARALTGVKRQPARARMLAETARDEYSASEAAHEDSVEAVERWLTDHPQDG